MIALMLLVAGHRSPTPIPHVRAVTSALHPPGPWSCEVTETKTYCCQAPAKLVGVWPSGYMCEEKTSAGFVDLSPPAVVERVEGDSL